MAKSSKNQESDYDLDALDDCDKPRAVFYQFKEHKEILKLIDKFPALINDLRAKERSYERFLFICDSYQEQPHLIDPFLGEIFDGLVNIVKKTKDAELIHETFKYMHCVAKMRGYKKIVQHLPHEVVDFEPILSLLSQQSPKDFANWQTRYMLLLWLSIVCMAPFDLSRFDNQKEDKNQLLMNRVINVCTPYLFVCDKSQDASAYLLAKFMSRLDVSRTVLPNFYQQLLDYLAEGKKNGENFKLLGALKCIAAIYKYGKREELLNYTVPTINLLMKLKLNEYEVTVARKFFIKIIQRIGLTFFKERVAKWRYQRGSRVLVENIKKSNSDANMVTNEKSNGAAEDDDDDDDIDVPPEMESIIEQLLLSLKDRDTIVRWSGAKGIGRITNRMSKGMAEDVLSSLLELFEFVEDDSAWHGGCLAIAELGRRGLLLPQQLASVVPIILKALVFDKKLGNYSLGRNVRDAACYVCWAFARAFESHILKPYVNDIAGTLLIATVFDREVNCRRAASAAFQENVGRQDQFPHGIDILTKADYFAVGNIVTCYLDLSVFLAKFDEYTESLISHLLNYKFNHWDIEIRELTSKAFYNLAQIVPEYISKNVVDHLLESCLHFDLNTRHGAILSISQVIHSLCDYARENGKSKTEFISQETINKLKNLIDDIQNANYFRGFGGEIMRPAVCSFIKEVSVAKLFDNLDVKFMTTCENFLNECFEYNLEIVQQAAVEALPFFCDLHLHERAELDKTFCEEFIRKFVSKFATSKEQVRSGYSLALGSLPKYILQNNFEFAVKSLMEITKIKSDNSVWVQSRRDAVKSILNLCKLIKDESDIKYFGIDDNFLLNIYECFFNTLNDYTTDSRGDSGSRVREMSIEAIEAFTYICSKNAKQILTEDLLTKILGGIMKQTTERIDRTRNCAGNAFKNLLFNEDVPIKKLSYAKQLYALFKKLHLDVIEWSIPSDTFALFAKALHFEPLQKYLLMGFVFSIGALTESVVKAATRSFHKELQEMYSKKKQIYINLIKTLLQITHENIKNERLSSSLVKTVDLLIQYNLFNDEELMKENIQAEFLGLFIDNCKGSGDVLKLLASVDLFCDMLQFHGRVRERSMIQLSIMLCHQYPKIRKAAASKLYEAMLNFTDIIPEENNDETINLLIETDWDQPLDVIRPIRNRICDLTNTPKPVLLKKKTTATSEAAQASNTSESK